MEELNRIQRELKAPKGQYNKFGKYKYRSCEDILEAVKPLLQDSVLILSDSVEEIAGVPYVEACAIFKEPSGKHISVKAQAGINLQRKGMDISQSFGSSSSYARKYALAGLFLLDDTKDADTKEADTEDANTEESAEFALSQAQIEALRKKLSAAHQQGQLTKTFFALPPEVQNLMRDYANALKSSS